MQIYGIVSARPRWIASTISKMSGRCEKAEPECPSHWLLEGISHAVCTSWQCVRCSVCHVLLGGTAEKKERWNTSYPWRLLNFTEVLPPPDMCCTLINECKLSTRLFSCTFRYTHKHNKVMFFFFALWGKTDLGSVSTQNRQWVITHWSQWPSQYDFYIIQHTVNLHRKKDRI